MQDSGAVGVVDLHPGGQARIVDRVAIGVLRLAALGIKAVVQGVVGGAASVVGEVVLVAQRVDDLQQLFAVG